MRKILLSDHFSIPAILLFSLPSIGMQLVDNTYQVADGYFISNYIGSSAFAAENLIFPPLALVAAIGLMFGTGAAAVISRALGEKQEDQANRLLSMTVCTLLAAGLLISMLLFIFMRPVARLVGVPEDLMDYCVDYGQILAVCMPFQILNAAFHPLLITANRPGLGLLISVLNAAVNIILDAVLVALLGWGLRGAAIATGLAWIVSTFFPACWFLRKSEGLRFGRPVWLGKMLGRICYNGSSEMASAASYAFIAMLFNRQLLLFAGEEGVSAYAVSVYVSGVFVAVFTGLSMSITPSVGYHLGKKNWAELRSLQRNGFLATGGLGLCMALGSILLAPGIAEFFVGYSPTLTNLAAEALRIISLSFLLCGMTSFSSAFFTGLGNGTASLCISSVKSFIAPLPALLLLPGLLNRTGIWLVTPLSEAAALLISFGFFIHERPKLHAGR